MNILPTLLVTSLATGYLLQVWFKKNTFVEYMTLLGLGSWFHVHDYRSVSQSDPEMTYVKFLGQNWDNWLVRLLTCPICLAPWISAVMLGCSLPGWYKSWPWFLPMMFASGYLGLYLHFKLDRLVSND
jgi:hypothetical protein